MTERRGTKSDGTGRALLDLAGGDQSGLQKAFQRLVGRPALSDNRAILILQRIGFIQDKDGLLSHEMASDRRVQPVFDQKLAPEAAAIDFAAQCFPEMEFYLPYISLRAAYQKSIAKANQPLPPEPDYDEDGFLLEYS